MAKEPNMIQIARMFGENREQANASAGGGSLHKERPLSGAHVPVDVHSGQTPTFTIERMDCPAYLVNYNFQLEWCNEAAEQYLFGPFDRFSDNIEERNIFQILLNDSKIRRRPDFEDVLRFHLSLAKNRLPESRLLMGNVHIMPEDLDRLMQMYGEVDATGGGPIIRAGTDIALPQDGKMRHIYACIFREGILLVYSPVSDESLLSYLSGREAVIRDLLKRRRPYQTPLTVLVADLQNSTRICAELPPEEYFELINSIWMQMQPLLRKYYGVCGKHAGDGVVYYFFPQPDHSHPFNALCCAKEMQDCLREIDREWRRRKNWLNELRLNIGLEEGEEWFGTFQTPTQFEMMVLGGTVNRASRLSDFARDGGIWASKGLLGKLAPHERRLLQYGIRRRAEHGREFFLSESFARISDLIEETEQSGNGKLLDIHDLVVAEVLDVTVPAERSGINPNTSGDRGYRA